MRQLEGHGTLRALNVQLSGPFLLVWSAGFLLDERGIKMSKSIGNVVDPRTVMLGGKDQKKVRAFYWNFQARIWLP